MRRISDWILLAARMGGGRTQLSHAGWTTRRVSREQACSVGRHDQRPAWRPRTCRRCGKGRGRAQAQPADAVDSMASAEIVGARCCLRCHSAPLRFAIPATDLRLALLQSGKPRNKRARDALSGHPLRTSVRRPGGQESGDLLWILLDLRLAGTMLRSWIGVGHWCRRAVLLRGHHD